MLQKIQILGRFQNRYFALVGVHSWRHALVVFKYMYASYYTE